MYIISKKMQTLIFIPSLVNSLSNRRALTDIYALIGTQLQVFIEGQIAQCCSFNVYCGSPLNPEVISVWNKYININGQTYKMTSCKKFIIPVRVLLETMVSYEMNKVTSRFRIMKLKIYIDSYIPALRST